jgi:hypothetical protein
MLRALEGERRSPCRCREVTSRVETATHWTRKESLDGAGTPGGPAARYAGNVRQISAQAAFRTQSL